MNDLIDRYIWAVVKDLPSDTREDVARELRATISDMVEARGPQTEVTIRAVLTELGDPAALATEYAGKKRYLIGPFLYPIYTRLLGTLLAIVVPIVFAVTLIAELWDPAEGIGPAIAAAVGGGIQTAVTMAFVITLVFGLLERAGPGREEWAVLRGRPWDPDCLPPITERRQIRLHETVTSLTFQALIVVLVLWQRTHSVLHVDGEPVPLFANRLWSVWIPLFIAVIGVMMAIEVWKYVAGRWTLTLVVANIAANLVFAGLAIALSSSGEVVNPAFIAALEDRVGGDVPMDFAVMALLVGALIVCVWDSVDGVLGYRRARRSAIGTEAI